MAEFLLIIESSDIGARYIATAAEALGLRPIFFCRLQNYQADTLSQIKEFDFVDIDTSDAAGILNYVKNSNYRIGGVITTLDSYLHIASWVAKELGCAGLDPSVIELKDKVKVFELIPEFSPQTMPFSRRKPDREGLLKLLRDSSHGIIVKPRFAAGALGFNVVTTQVELDACLGSILEIGISEQLYPDLWMAQERIYGELVSCEGFVVSGVPTFLGFTGSLKVGHTQSKLFFPHDRSISQEARDEAFSAIKALVLRSGFQKGYFHTEFLVCENKAVLIDANFGRVGGGSIAEHIALGAGIDAAQVFKHFVEVTLFNKASFELDSSMMKKSTWAYLYGISKEGILQELNLPKNMKCLHTRILDDGARVPAMGTNNWAWIGILTGSLEDLNREFAQIKVRTENEWIRPTC